MFFDRYVAALGAEWEELLPSLSAPAKHGRYHAFEAIRCATTCASSTASRARASRARRARRSGCSRAARSRSSRVDARQGDVRALRDPGRAPALPGHPQMVARASEGTREACSATDASPRLRDHGASEQALALVEGRADVRRGAAARRRDRRPTAHRLRRELVATPATARSERPGSERRPERVGTTAGEGRSSYPGAGTARTERQSCRPPTASAGIIVFPHMESHSSVRSIRSRRTIERRTSSREPAGERTKGVEVEA